MSKKQKSRSIKLNNGSKILHSEEHLVEHAKANLMIVHGFGEHQGRYSHVVEFFNNHGINVFTIDLRGHGLSGGKRGGSHGIEDFISDLALGLENMDNVNRLPNFLLGHSFGGLLAAGYCLRFADPRLRGIILSSPWFELALSPSPIKLGLAKLLHRLNLNLPQNANLNQNHLSSFKEVGQAYVEDELVHGRMTPRTFFEIVQFGQWCKRNAHDLKMNCLVTHGTDDRIISIKGSQSFANQAGVEFVPIEDAMHEPHNDVQKDQLFDLYYDWILKALDQ